MRRTASPLSPLHQRLLALRLLRRDERRGASGNHRKTLKWSRSAPMDVATPRLGGRERPLGKPFLAAGHSLGDAAEAARVAGKAAADAVDAGLTAAQAAAAGAEAWGAFLMGAQRVERVNTPIPVVVEAQPASTSALHVVDAGPPSFPISPVVGAESAVEDGRPSAEDGAPAPAVGKPGVGDLGRAYSAKYNSVETQITRALVLEAVRCCEACTVRTSEAVIGAVRELAALAATQDFHFDPTWRVATYLSAWTQASCDDDARSVLTDIIGDIMRGNNALVALTRIPLEPVWCPEAADVNQDGRLDIDGEPSPPHVSSGAGAPGTATDNRMRPDDVVDRIGQQAAVGGSGDQRLSADTTERAVTPTPTPGPSVSRTVAAGDEAKRLDDLLALASQTVAGGLGGHSQRMRAPLRVGRRSTDVGTHRSCSRSAPPRNDGVGTPRDEDTVTFVSEANPPPPASPPPVRQSPPPSGRVTRARPGRRNTLMAHAARAGRVSRFTPRGQGEPAVVLRAPSGWHWSQPSHLSRSPTVAEERAWLGELAKRVRERLKRGMAATLDRWVTAPGWSAGASEGETPFEAGSTSFISVLAAWEPTNADVHKAVYAGQCTTELNQSLYHSVMAQSSRYSTRLRDVLP